MPGVSDVGVVMNWTRERILLSTKLFSRIKGSRVGSRIVHVPWMEAEGPLAEVDENFCLFWSRAAEPVRLVEGNGLTWGILLLATVQGLLRETLSVIVVRKSVSCPLPPRDRVCEVDRGRGIKKRDG